MDLESITDELYALYPADFTAARNARAAAVRKAGDRELAGQIQALRRPTISAWAGNQLVRRQPDQVQTLISLGEGLRQAHRDLDGEQLRELSRQQHALVGAVARQARQLAAEAGHPVSEGVQYEIEATLHAVLADSQAAQEWAAGRLTRPLSPPVGFTAATADIVPRTAPSPGPSTDQADTAAEARTKAGREQLAQLARAKKDAKAAEQQARAREEELAQAETDKEQAERRLQTAEEETAALADQLKEANERRRAARDDLGEARNRAREAGTTARRARRQAQDAAAHAERVATDDM
ncbi:hypothetical protein FBY35_4083 [Streptomyces sp. SLBN-118]|uniref:hypothetical protein n=1 Tax=Streptomyces sp. SLBN-118 TaxID=2768454 RepID=UPI00114F2DB2|nr:hypothetical protein [Streptomyces sp. SLBN-118]TQK42655.1 hypothetical protein FBY35_4083 [Streptomyces sp. SLBN-118]